MHRFQITLAGVALISFTGCIQKPLNKPDFVIAAAADLRFAMDDVVQRFQQKHSDVVVKAIYGSSGNFSSQIESGAPFDVFCSADLSYPRMLAGKGLTVPDSEFTYAQGRIVLWVKSSSPIQVEKLGIDSLRAPSIRYIAIANPAHAPYGKAAVAALQSLGVYDAVKDKVAYGENIAQTLQFVQLGSADIGIVALSLALAPPVRGTGRYWEIPLASYPAMQQGGVILKSTKLLAIAKDFRSFMLDDQVRAILQNYGFTRP